MGLEFYPVSESVTFPAKLVVSGPWRTDCGLGEVGRRFSVRMYKGSKE